MSQSKKILIIQTAFIGDVILATSLIEAIKKEFPGYTIDFLLRNGNQSLLQTNPHIRNIFIWEKKKKKVKSLIENLILIRKEKYDYVFNIQRFFSSGLLTALSGAKRRVGFNKNPLSFLFTKKIKHQIPHYTENGYLHEVQRNLLLASELYDNFSMPKDLNLKPKIYFNEEDKTQVNKYQKGEKYFVLAPSSVWYTKQWHSSKWTQLITHLSQDGIVYVIGGPDDKEYLDKVIPSHTNAINLCGKLSLRQSALLMKKATRVFVNDSAPLHLASSVNANTTAIFCSTVPEFGYYPLSDNSKLIQLEPRLECMPCGLHGHKQCPLGHFSCAMDIEVSNVYKTTLNI